MLVVGSDEHGWEDDGERPGGGGKGVARAADGGDSRYSTPGNSDNRII